MVKVLYVIGTLDVGGTERQLVELAGRLDRSRFEPVVCCLTARGVLADALERAGVRVHVAGYHGLTIANLRALARFLRIVRAERPGVVHGFLFWAYVLGAFAARVSRVPAVVASRRSLSHFKAGTPHYRLLERVANRLTDLVVANSEAVRRDAIDTERLPPEKVRVVYNGLDLDSYRGAPDPATRRALDIPDQAPVVLVVANFIAYKAHQDFMEAWAPIVRTTPGAVAVLVGEGPTRSDIEALARELGIEHAVRFAGRRMDVPDLLAASDLLVHPSLQEGFSNAILEAMAAGKPVVATAVGGNVEAVVDGQTGFLVPPADAPALTDAVRRVLCDADLRRTLGEAARDRAARLYDVRRMVAEYEQLYDEVWQRRGRR